ncbi:hypothetical protein GCM10010406_38710 [Streptomyces thermolineatus]|uniref:Uncharacterized protein n=1 Tax=Streptomyces thermolineatus TaxID=44033 RepID=A0ABP5ZP97_9ACTN
MVRVRCTSKLAALVGARQNGEDVPWVTAPRPPPPAPGRPDGDGAGDGAEDGGAGQRVRPAPVRQPVDVGPGVGGGAADGTSAAPRIVPTGRSPGRGPEAVLRGPRGTPRGPGGPVPVAPPHRAGPPVQ